MLSQTISNPRAKNAVERLGGIFGPGCDVVAPCGYSVCPTAHHPIEGKVADGRHLGITTISMSETSVFGTCPRNWSTEGWPDSQASEGHRGILGLLQRAAKMLQHGLHVCVPLRGSLHLQQWRVRKPVRSTRHPIVENGRSGTISLFTVTGTQKAIILKPPPQILRRNFAFLKILEWF